MLHAGAAIPVALAGQEFGKRARIDCVTTQRSSLEGAEGDPRFEIGLV